MPDLTDSRLARPEGQGQPFQVITGAADLLEAPDPSSRLATQALFGEIVDGFRRSGDYMQMQSRRDNYVGWIHVSGLSEQVTRPTHKVSALRTFAYAGPDLKAPVECVLSRGATLALTATEGQYVKCVAGWVHSRHVALLDAQEADPVSVAETYLNTPYRWGGRDSVGLDCTGLIQQAFEAAGVLLPRDSDMQYAWAGEDIGDWKVSGALKRGDLVFWKGHAGIMTDAHHLLHANAWHMEVAREPLDQAITRIKTYYAEPVGARRIDLDSRAGQVPHWMGEPVAY
ncbi:MAG: C40 family peptidase [Alphaproteobacteria bacterium]|nr:C40 family peptidase [Alphaproteobacteria bacterium]MBU2084487.1 C40 family peptidase [Alphaproteobacteria bacterium]MBU2142495.1 C40 family peptidase [Alphaproteobacteria bacterium]MBU2197752.1 C40 family peptidase [Alphaproteobacteria bacterium]